MTTRRELLGHSSASAALLGAWYLPLDLFPPHSASAPHSSDAGTSAEEAWNTT